MSVRVREEIMADEFYERLDKVLLARTKEEKEAALRDLYRLEGIELTEEELTILMR